MKKERAPSMRALFSIQNGIAINAVAGFFGASGLTAALAGIVYAVITWLLIDVYWNWPDKD